MENQPIQQKKESETLSFSTVESRIVLPGDLSMVFLYVNLSQNGYIDDLIKRNFDFLKDSFSRQGYTFVYLPELLNPSSQDGLMRSIKYNYPDYAAYDDSLFNALSETTTLSLTQYIFDAVGLDAKENPIIQNPGLLKRAEKLDRNSFVFLKIEVATDIEFRKSISDYLRSINHQVRFQIVGSTEYEYDADDSFSTDAERVSSELRTQIEYLSLNGYLRLAIQSFPESLRNELLQTLSEKKQQISRLHIDADFRIFLCDYNNIEIEMSPLPKTVYIFFLRHPEGVSFKNLQSHKNELISIYKNLFYHNDEEKMLMAINDLVNPLNNSINEKCSRIKEAFVKHIHPSIAANYQVKGIRGYAKTIPIDRSLITLDFTLK